MTLVLVERSFSEPAVFEELAEREKGKAWCLEAHDVTFVRSYFSADKKRMFCLYRAPDAEAVRKAQTDAGMPFDVAYPVSELPED